jgi:hypothetical protein
VTLRDGRKIEQPIRYGLDVRSESDPAGTLIADRTGTISVVRLDLGISPVAIESVTISNRGSYAGLRLRGLTLL